MALVPTSTKSVMTGVVYEQFLEFSRPIIIYKQPAQTIVSTPQNLLYGYNNISQTTNSEITLSSESATHSGLIIHNFKVKNQTNNSFDNKINLADGKSYVKLAQPGFDYIYNGTKTEKLECDNATYNVSEKWQPQYFLDLRFYYIEIERTY